MLRSLLLGLLLLLGPAATWAQTVPVAPHGYDFLTVTSIESASDSFAKLLITPSFQDKSEVPLEDYNVLNVEKLLNRIEHNTQIINQKMGDLTATGWELVDVHTYNISVPKIIPITRYLFRKPRP